MSLLIILAVGAISGLLIHTFFPHYHKGKIADTVLGSLGALEAVFLLNGSIYDLSVFHVAVGIIGAASFILIQRMLLSFGELPQQ